MNIISFFKKISCKKSLICLSLRSVLLIFLITVFIEFLFLSSHVGRVSFDDLLAKIVPGELIELTNIRREDAGVAQLNPDPALTAAALMKARDMAENEYFAHTSPEGVTPWYWFEKVGYDYNFAGENLAVNFTEAERVDQAWMDSPSHRRNIINERFEDIGIATAEGRYRGRRAYFVVQLFGTRAPETVETFSYSEEQDPVTLESNQEELVLGEQKEATSVLSSEESNDEKDIEEKESFALIRRDLNDNPSLIIGSPEKSLPYIEDQPEYKTFWEKITSSGQSMAYFLLIFGYLFSLMILLNLLVLKKVSFAAVTVNGLTILIITLSGFLTSHFVLQLTVLF